MTSQFVAYAPNQPNAIRPRRFSWPAVATPCPQLCCPVPFPSPTNLLLKSEDPTRGRGRRVPFLVGGQYRFQHKPPEVRPSGGGGRMTPCGLIKEALLPTFPTTVCFRASLNNASHDKWQIVAWYPFLIPIPEWQP